MGSQGLRPFSGLEEPGPGEESFESWLDHAKTCCTVAPRSERERRRRLVESLGGPAWISCVASWWKIPTWRTRLPGRAGAGVWEQGHPVTARLKFDFAPSGPRRLLCHMMRLEGLLPSALEKGAIHPAIADQVRARQVLMRARRCCTPEQAERRMRLERRPPGFVGMLRLIRETEAPEAGPAGSEQLQVEEEARVNPGDLAGAPAVPAQEYVAQASSARRSSRGHHCRWSQGSPAGEGTAQGALSKEGSTEATPACEEASKAAPGTGEAGEADPETHVATGAAPAPGETSKSSPATQGDENPPIPARTGSASREAPGGPGCEPENLTQAGDQEVRGPPRRGSSPSQRTGK
ncbi:Paraneoplastic antigen Ma6F [Camelus dromedarius]|uniref:Paraneoplastic antigen Ma6F n=1 Tax=Camelus dromedarius TaxID=9838 RepID=A0A5N4C355_CAMDR|nr:Paraneoplastic antigen Ma6F [Camelus dromedarius]